MIKELKIWDKGKMTLNVDGKLKTVYVSQDNLEKAYDNLQKRLEKGKIPFGVDHFPEAILNASPILKKLDIMNLGDFDGAELKEDGLYAKNVNFKNNKIQELYKKGDISDVSIVSKSKLKECPLNDYDYSILDTDIYRVDIVEKGACPSCKLPVFNDEAEEAIISASYVENFKKEDYPMSLKDKIQENNPKTKTNDGEGGKNGTSLVEELVKSNNNLMQMVKQLYDVVMKYENDDSNVDPNGNAQQTNGIVAASQNAVLLNEVKELKNMLTEDRKAAEDQKINAYLDACVQAGKFVPAQLEIMKKLASADFKSFSEMMDKQEAVIDLTGQKKVSLSASANLNFGNDDKEDVFKDIDFFNKLKGEQ